MKTRTELLNARQTLEEGRDLLTNREYAEAMAELEALWAEMLKSQK